jgi:hypothetical protein
VQVSYRKALREVVNIACFYYGVPEDAITRALRRAVPEKQKDRLR